LTVRIIFIRIYQKDTKLHKIGHPFAVEDTYR